MKITFNTNPAADFFREDGWEGFSRFGITNQEMFRAFLVGHELGHAIDVLGLGRTAIRDNDESTREIVSKCLK